MDITIIGTGHMARGIASRAVAGDQLSGKTFQNGLGTGFASAVKIVA
jgi:hypothetical protein